MSKRILSALAAVVLLALPLHGVAMEGAAISVSDVAPDDTADAKLPEFLPLDVQVKMEDGVKLLVKTYEVTSDVEPQQLVEQNPIRGGVEYMLRETLREELPGTAEQKAASRTISISSESDQRSEILPLLPEFLDYSENRFTGRLTLEADNLTTEVESTSSYSYEVSDTRQFYGLARNDPYYIPKTSTKNRMTLSLVDVAWSPTGGNEAAPLYSATATYTGNAYGSKTDGYLVTAQYSGSVERTVPGNVRYSIVYEAVPVPILPESFDWQKAGLISVCTLGGCTLVVFAVLLLKKHGLPIRRKKAAAVGFEDYQSKPERRKPHALGYMKREVDVDDE